MIREEASDEEGSDDTEPDCKSFEVWMVIREMMLRNFEEKGKEKGKGKEKRRKKEKSG